jgi:hypothetical protein
MFSLKNSLKTPLHFVAFRGYTDIVKTFVTKHNAAIDALSMVRVAQAQYYNPYSDAMSQVIRSA